MSVSASLNSILPNASIRSWQSSFLMVICSWSSFDCIEVDVLSLRWYQSQRCD